MSRQNDDGGRAFPRPHDFAGDGEVGMTLRQWYAGQALAALAVREFDTVEGLARRAFRIADEMLKASV